MSMLQSLSGWSTTTLGSLGRWGSGGTPNRSNLEYYKGGEIPWLVIGDLNESVVTRSQTYITASGVENSSAKLLQPGTLLIAMYGSIGKTAITGIPCTTNQAIAHCTPHPGVNLRYLHRAIQWLKPILIKQGQGGAQQNISQGILKEQTVPLAPELEQIRIADKLDTVLTRVDAVNARLARVAPLLKRFRQSVLAAATSGRLTEDWRVQRGIAAETKSDMVYGEIPAQWTVLPLDELKAAERYSLAIGPFGSNLTIKDYTDSGVPLVFVREIRAKSFNDGRTKYVSTEKASELNAHIISGGDILITKMGDPPGDVAIYPLDYPDAVITADCIKLRVNPEEVQRSYAAYALQSPKFQKVLLTAVAGVAQQKVSLARFRVLPLVIPTLQEQAEIVRRVETLFAFADRLEARLQAARTAAERLTPALLAKAFRGELVPQDPNDEPAAELLKRLAASAPATTKRHGRPTKAA